jgi:ribosomal protein L37AE/L43A
VCNATLNCAAAAVPPMQHGPEGEMKCPKCGMRTLRQSGDGVGCRTCGYELTPGEVDKYRLYRLIRNEEEGRTGGA